MRIQIATRNMIIHHLGYSLLLGGRGPFFADDRFFHRGRLFFLGRSFLMMQAAGIEEFWNSDGLVF